MSTSNVVSLEELRGHREARLRLILAMHQVDEDRWLVAERLREVLQLTSADRGALVWIDEYGPGLVHTYCLLDVLSDRPRRSFSVEPLRRAWERGIPGLLDEPDLPSSSKRILAEGPRSLAAVALGSDGLRAWFLVVDSKTPRPSFDSGTADGLLFLAGECASIVIHEDPDARGSSISDRGAGSDRVAPSSFERERRSRFPGWPVLQDVDDGEEDAGRDRAVTLRFLVARLLRELVDDDFAVDSGVFRQHIEAVRGEIRQVLRPGEAEQPWGEVLDSLQGQDYGRLAASVLTLAVDAENEGHLHGARELNRLAYDVAVAGCHAEEAVEAARFLGRVNRRLGSWEESSPWYEAAVAVAGAAGLSRGQALALDGLGNTHRVRGNFPKAREAYVAVLGRAKALDDSDLRGRAHQNLALVEKHAGRTDEALKHGWEAVQSFLGSNELDFSRALVDLGDIFLRSGELDSAEHAFQVVASGVENLDVRVLALDALGHIAALRGDRAGFERWLDRLQQEPMENVSIEVMGELMIHRALSFVALADLSAAEEWLRRTIAHAEKNGLNRVLFRAEEICDQIRKNRAVDSIESELPPPSSETLSELRGPLHALPSPATAAP